MIVIDADIAGSAGAKGEDSPAERARTAYRCLRDWERSPHVMVLVPDLLAEWQLVRKTNPQAKRILASQVARRRVLEAERPAMADVKAALEEAPLQKGMREAIDKDLHLLEAARVGALLVFSFDGKVRRHLRRAATQLRPLFPDLRWNNPEKEPATLSTLMLDTRTPADATPLLFPADVA